MCFPSFLSNGSLWGLWGSEALGARGDDNYSYSGKVQGLLGFLVWTCLGANEVYEEGRAVSSWSITEGFLRASHPGCIAGAV